MDEAQESKLETSNRLGELAALRRIRATVTAEIERLEREHAERPHPPQPSRTGETA